MPSAASRAVEPTKVCGGPCGQRKPYSAYHKRTVKGREYCKPYCRPCDRERVRVFLAANPDKRRQYDRTRNERIKADPERAAIRRDQDRERKRRALGVTPDRYRISQRMRDVELGTDPELDPAPFAHWLADRAADVGGIRALSVVLDLPERTVGQIIRARQLHVDRSTVDKAVSAWGSLNARSEMYPESF